MPRDALWIALRKLGVSDQLIQCTCTIKSFHEAKPSIDGEVLEEVEVENGLRQGSTIWLLHCSICMLVFWVREVNGVETYLL